MRSSDPRPPRLYSGALGLGAGLAALSMDLGRGLGFGGFPNLDYDFGPRYRVPRKRTKTPAQVKRDKVRAIAKASRKRNRKG